MPQPQLSPDRYYWWTGDEWVPASDHADGRAALAGISRPMTARPVAVITPAIPPKAYTGPTYSPYTGGGHNAPKPTKYRKARRTSPWPTAFALVVLLGLLGGAGWFVQQGLAHRAQAARATTVYLNLLQQGQLRAAYDQECTHVRAHQTELSYEHLQHRVAAFTVGTPPLLATALDATAAVPVQLDGQPTSISLALEHGTWKVCTPAS